MDKFDNWIKDHADKYNNLLIDFINIDTTSPYEINAESFVHRELTNRGFKVEKKSIADKIWEHPYHCSRELSKINENSTNFIAYYNANAEKTIIINSHLDVVPVGKGFQDGFNAKLKNGKIYGRGACDTKNNLIMLLGALDYLKYIGADINHNILLHLPIEEEIGGNGTLSLVLTHDMPTKCVIVFEPTNFSIYRGHRGCITFKITVQGKPTHMGEKDKGVSAIDASISVIEKLKELEQSLLENAKNDPDFSIWDKPLQLNIGTINAGEWHGSVPESSVITGNLGFLPSHDPEDIMDLILSQVGNIAKQLNISIESKFIGLKNNAYIMPEKEDIISSLKHACEENGVVQDKTYGWNVSCDARTYFNELNIPTVIFGCGHLENAHSSAEHIDIQELHLGMKILATFFSTKEQDI